MSDSQKDLNLPIWLLDGYRRFRDNDFVRKEEHDRKLAEEGQKPRALWVGCADSRVIPERILGAVSGDVFVVRNVANIVPPSETKSTSIGAAVEYAVQALNIEEIIVCGHEECGGMKALMSGADVETMPNLAEWIQYSHASCCGEKGENLEEVVKTNAVQQLEHLRTYPCVAEAERERGLRLWAFYYGLKNGSLQLYDPESTKWVIVE